jgi:pimeloyl-ACP methyl ester carboxylesterase
VANASIDDITAHFTKIIDSLDASPIVIGHSFGGLIAEKLLGQGIGVAAVGIDPAQIKGVLPLPLAQLHAALPTLRNPWPAAADLGNGRPHRARRDDPLHTQAVSPFQRCRRAEAVRRPWSLLDHRQRMAGGCSGRPSMAEGSGRLTF